MTDSRAAVSADRLPWLQDEAQPRRKAASRRPLGWLAAMAILLVAAASYWLGQRSAERVPTTTVSSRNAPATTIPLPRARAVEPAQPQVQAGPMPDVAPVPVPSAPVSREISPPQKRAGAAAAVPSPAARGSSKSKADSDQVAADQPAVEAEPSPKSNEHPDRPWPVRVTDGASGRLVRVGAFTTSRQAKKAWWAMMRNNPSLKRLPALVVPAPSLRDGRTYYRLQMGTTSQAHSEVLCQRMRSIGQSCVVIEVYNRGEGNAG